MHFRSLCKRTSQSRQYGISGGLFFFIALLATQVFAVNYYVDATSGLDSRDGRSTATAWKSISKVTGSSFAAGDSILFKRGETFRGNLRPSSSGSASAYIVYSTYGSGPKPKLHGSYNGMNSAEWTNAGNNIWTIYVPMPSSGQYPNDVGNVIFNNEAFCGTKVSTSGSLNAQGKFWSDAGTSRLHLYSTSNPASFYTNIEIAYDRHLISMYGPGYMIIENLDLRYAGAHGIVTAPGHHLFIRDCDISYIGGGYISFGGPWRFGNGIEFWEGANNITVERCRISQCYDAAVTAQGSNDCQVYNIYWRNNIIATSEYIWEFFEYGNGSNTHDLYFENNTCLSAGGGFGHSQRFDGGPYCSFIQCWGGLDGQSSNLFVRNNIFLNSARDGVFVGNGVDRYIIDKNIWYSTTNMVMRINSTSYNVATQWSAYKTASGFDANSLYIDPQINSDYSLKPGSPCIDAGLVISGITTDFNRNLRIGNPDLGAFEYSSTSIREEKAASQLDFHSQTFKPVTIVRLSGKTLPVNGAIYDLAGKKSAVRNAGAMPSGMFIVR